MRGARATVAAWFGGATVLVLPAVTIAYEYPTKDTVEYVLECIQEHPDRPGQEMLYKCSCALDYFRKRVKHDRFVDLLTAEKARSIAGERSPRDAPRIQDDAKKFRDMQAKAFKDCYLK